MGNIFQSTLMYVYVLLVLLLVVTNVLWKLQIYNEANE